MSYVEHTCGSIHNRRPKMLISNARHACLWHIHNEGYVRVLLILVQNKETIYIQCGIFSLETLGLLPNHSRKYPAPNPLEGRY